MPTSCTKTSGLGISLHSFGSAHYSGVKSGMSATLRNGGRDPGTGEGHRAHPLSLGGSGLVVDGLRVNVLHFVASVLVLCAMTIN